MKTSSNRTQLNGLRAMAIIMVLMSHFWMYDVSRSGLNRFFQSGWIGVDLFFVLSGYLITDILIRTRDSPGSGSTTSPRNLWVPSAIQ
ncbi:MAG: acyltransferase family protein [Steroidobacteraceae bacterium]